MGTREKNRLVISIFFLTMLLVFLFTFTANAFNKPQEKFTEVIVHKDDTLWAIAERITPNNGDIRDTVYNIRKINHLSSPVLHPGQRILIPRQISNDIQMQFCAH